MKALIDTGSDITIAESSIANKYRWKVRTSELKSVKTANNEPMVITGVTNEPLLVGKKVIWSDIYVTPDIDDMILGVDWLRKRGRMTWNFENHHVRFGDDEWIELQQGSDHHCRRICVESDTILEPRQETAVPVCAKRRTTGDRPHVRPSECRQILNLSHVCSDRSLLPAKFTGLHVSVVNAHSRPQILRKKTNLGELERANIVESHSDAATVDDDSSCANTDVVQQMMEGLPAELTDNQRDRVRDLLLANESIFSKGEYDIRRTPLVECGIDTGDHRPIRQPLRRQPFEYLKVIDEQVANMTKAGIIEPAASPWASNVDLVRFCVDYRQLNSVSKEDSYPLPLIDNGLNALQG